MDSFNEIENQKTKLLVAVRNWDKKTCIDFLSNIRDRYNLAPNLNNPQELLYNMDISKLKSMIVGLVQSCDDLSQLESFPKNYLM